MGHVRVFDSFKTLQNHRVTEHHEEALFGANFINDPFMQVLGIENASKHIAVSEEKYPQYHFMAYI
ncbi:hypothetical protein RR46_12962 [Papilio xuthus]|uniref:Uncharacterized protein n=1 Tax=Papilio xuthus TaxID=66420 RepID=A0A194PKE5_PAPXU|nr:hypothetical protein RR46_12962 [Papilio xuthus]